MMPGRKLSCLSAVIAAAVGTLCVGCAGMNYQGGVNRANEELKEGHPCIYSTLMYNVGQTDPTSGLPYLVLEETITPEMLKMIEGHNSTIYAKYHEGVK